MWTQLRYKCKKCGLWVNLDTDDVIYNKNKYYHFDCYVADKFQKQGRRKIKLTKQEIEIKARELQKTDDNIKKEIARERFNKWLQINYNVVMMPSYIYTKIDSVLDGTYKGLNMPVLLEDLFDMWKTKKTQLDKIANNNKNKGKEMSQIQRISYDLAILLSKYDDYLKWKEKNKLAYQNEVEIKEELKNKINYNTINITNNKNKNKKEEIDIMDILNEI